MGTRHPQLPVGTMYRRAEELPQPHEPADMQVSDEHQEQAGAVNTEAVGDPAVMTYDEVLEASRARLSSQLVGFDPTIIIAIVSAIIQLIGNKRPSERTAQAVQDCCNKRPFAALVRLNLYLQRQGVPAKHRAQAAQAALEMGKKAKFDEVVAFCNCCENIGVEE